MCIETISRVLSALVQEITKIEKSFKDPKFMELLADYAKDMADPEVMHSACRFIPHVHSGLLTVQLGRLYWHTAFLNFVHV